MRSLMSSIDLRRAGSFTVLVVFALHLVSCASSKVTCSKAHCPTGCCDKQTGDCKEPSNTTCGTAGAKCVDCTAKAFVCETSTGKCWDGECGGCPEGQTCNVLTKVCEGPPPSCAVCDQGCCTLDDTCSVLQTDDACGMDGGDCNNCTTLGLKCNRTTGQCETDPWKVQGRARRRRR